MGCHLTADVPIDVHYNSSDPSSPAHFFTEVCKECFRKLGVCIFPHSVMGHRRKTQLIRVRTLQPIPMLLFGQFLHVSDRITLVDNFLTE